MYTNEQKKIINHKKGAAFVIAGPGTGKTHVSCARVKELIENGESAKKITSLTFSEAAADNMKLRLKEKFNVDNVDCLTTHGFGLKFITRHWEKLGFSASPKVNKNELARLLEIIVKEVAANNNAQAKNLRTAVYEKMKKNNSSLIKRDENLSPLVTEVLSRYKETKLRKNWVDFADMLKLPTQLLRNNNNILEEIGMTIDHLLVDEVQDMKMEECQLLFYLAKQAKSAVLVGDIKQLIYQFRGANSSGLSKLEKHLKPVKYHLTQSFRVPCKMLSLINAIGADINNDPILTSKKQGFSPCIFHSVDNDEQVKFIAKKINLLLGKGVAANDIAILGRTRRSLILFKNALQTKGIDSIETYCCSKEEPIKILKSLMFIAKWKYKCKEPDKQTFKPVNALKRVLEISGLSEEIQKELHKSISDNGWDSLAVSKECGDSIYRNILTLRRAVGTAALASPESGIQILIDAIKPFVGIKFGKNEKQIIIRDYSLIKTSVRNCKTWSDINFKALPKTYHKSGIELSTCHGAKGKEWKYVFIINMVDGEFPFYFTMKKVRLDEELRLFYVAASRASRKLYIVQSPVHIRTYGKDRQINITTKESKSIFVKHYASTLKLLE